tara:strand:- start:4073 stop:5137 length:1065 start_codon:yes stop_codon:yes gene_type:complete
VSPIVLIVAGDPNQFTGGYIYDQRIADALKEAGHSIDIVGLAGRFPEADATAADAMADTLASLPDDVHVVIDGLALGTLGETVSAHRGGRRVTALVHHPLADEAGLDEASARHLYDSERHALAGVDHVIVTSAFTARRLRERYAVPATRLSIVEPGVAAPAQDIRPRSAPPRRLLCIATLIPRKGHADLVTALAELADTDWVCDCIGDTRRDPAHTEAIERAIAAAGLTGRIRLHGAQPPEALTRAYAEADLFVLPSHYEGYGMVVTEAVSHCLPVVTTTGGALADTLPAEAGLAVAPGEPSALAAALEQCLKEPAVYAGLVAGARRAAASLADWPRAGQLFAAALADNPEIHA